MQSEDVYFLLYYNIIYTFKLLDDGSAQRIPPVALEWIPANRAVKSYTFRL